MKDSSDDVGLTTGNRGGTNHALETPWNGKYIEKKDMSIFSR
jgi:hypothetical protein